METENPRQNDEQENQDLNKVMHDQKEIKSLLQENKEIPSHDSKEVENIDLQETENLIESPVNENDRIELTEQNMILINNSNKFEDVARSQEMTDLNIDENDNLDTEVEGDAGEHRNYNSDFESSKFSKQKCFYFSILKGNYPENVKNAILLRKNWKELDENKDMFEHSQFIWKPTNFSVKDYGKIDLLTRRGAKFVYNHLQKINGICTKTGLIDSLKSYYEKNIEAVKIGYNIFDSTPTTYLLTPLMEGSEYKSFNYHLKSSRNRMDKDRIEYVDQNIPAKHCANGTWLVKPSSMNRGRGIEIFHNKEDILKFISTKPLFTKWVVQKYIERPLLYKQRKFDLRVWAVFNYTNEVFFYKKGYVRLSSENYSLDDKNNYVHLTNNCLQQLGDKYGAHEDGNTIGYEDLQSYLDETYPDK